MDLNILIRLRSRHINSELRIPNSEFKEKYMNLVLWIIFAVIALTATVFLGLREFHMLQLNGYKTPEHSRWMKKN